MPSRWTFSVFPARRRLTLEHLFGKIWPHERKEVGGMDRETMLAALMQELNRMTIEEIRLLLLIASKLHIA